MVKSYKGHSFLNGLRFTCVKTIKENKAKIIITTAFVFVAICVGVFIAIKSNRNCTWGSLQEVNLSDFYMGIAGTSSAFFSRSISLVVNVSLLAVLSFSPFLLPLAQTLIIYRGYLFGLNFALIFIFYGFGSIFTAVVVILPCQILTLFLLIMFYVILQKMNCNSKKFGCSECNRFVYIIVALLLVLVVNLVETLLLCVLNGKVILVI